jgi:hypothetical protein
MANQKVFEITSADGDEIYIEYNDANLRIGNIFFTIPSGFNADVRIWDSGQLVFEDTYLPGFYDENVPGNYRVTEHIDPGDGSTYARMPPELSWSYSRVRI